MTVIEYVIHVWRLVVEPRASSLLPSRDGRWRVRYPATSAYPERLSCRMTYIVACDYAELFGGSVERIPRTPVQVEPAFVFTSTDCVTIAGRGRVYTVQNPRDCGNFKHLLGALVQIDRNRWRVRGVEHFMHSPPWRAGEAIGLLVRPDDDYKETRCGNN